MNALSVSRCLIATFATACLATGSQAQQGPPGGLNVNVLNTPLAVTGSVTTSGTVNLAPGATVSISNGTTDPAKTSSVDDPGRIPYQFNQHTSCTLSSPCQITTPPVPQNKRLVIKHVAGFGALSSPGNFVEVEVLTSNGKTLSALSPSIFGNPGAQGYTFDQSILGFADAGSTVIVTAGTNGSFQNDGLDSVITGYLLDCSVNHCDPIAP